MLTNNEFIYTAEDVAAILKISKSAAYRLIRQISEELKAEGYYVISGRVPQKRFHEKMYC